MFYVDKLNLVSVLELFIISHGLQLRSQTLPKQASVYLKRNNNINCLFACLLGFNRNAVLINLLYKYVKFYTIL